MQNVVDRRRIANHTPDARGDPVRPGRAKAATGPPRAAAGRRGPVRARVHGFGPRSHDPPFAAPALASARRHGSLVMIPNNCF